MIVTVPRLDRYCTGGGGDGGIVGGGFECIDVLTAGLKVNWSTGPRPLTIMVLGISQFPVQRPDHKIPFINSTVACCLFIRIMSTGLDRIQWIVLLALCPR